MAEPFNQDVMDDAVDNQDILGLREPFVNEDEMDTSTNPGPETVNGGEDEGEDEDEDIREITKNLHDMDLPEYDNVVEEQLETSVEDVIRDDSDEEVTESQSRIPEETLISNLGYLLSSDPLGTKVSIANGTERLYKNHPIDYTKIIVREVRHLDCRNTRIEITGAHSYFKLKRENETTWIYGKVLRMV